MDTNNPGANKHEGVTLLRNAADSGNKHAQYWVGLFLKRGDDPYLQNIDTAKADFNGAAKQTHYGAQALLLELAVSFPITPTYVSRMYSHLFPFFECLKYPLKWSASVGVAATTLLTSVAAAIDSTVNTDQKQAFIVAAAIVGGSTTFLATLSAIAENAGKDSKNLVQSLDNSPV